MPESEPTSGAAGPFANVLGVRIDASTLEGATKRIGDWVTSRARNYVCVCTANNLVEARRSGEYRDVLNGSGLNTSDGMPLVWELHRHGYGWATRVYGPDLLLSVSQASVAKGWRQFYFGGQVGVAALLSVKMSERFQGLEIAGALSPPLASLEDLCSEEVAAQINGSGADIVWVGLGTPKQEQWMARMRERLVAPVLIGVGAAFDFHTHRIPQAPQWMRDHGLEWLFRLVQEPRRLGRRYLIGNPQFVWELTCQRLGLKHFPLSPRP